MCVTVNDFFSRYKQKTNEIRYSLRLDYFVMFELLTSNMFSKKKTL